MRKHQKFIIIGLSFLLLATMILSISWGTYQFSIQEILQTLVGNGNVTQETILYSIRLPRIAVALCVGIALSTAGCILQSITKNELAEPGIIGINAGAAFAVVLLISSGNTQYFSNVEGTSLFAMPFVAIVGAGLAALLIYVLAYRGGASKNRLLLIGVGVNAGLLSLITLYQLNLSKGDFNQALTWISGSLWGSSWKFFFLIFPFLLIFLSLTYYHNKTLDVMDLGDELAIGLGVQVEKKRRLFLFFAVALAAISTAVAGNIAFLGLLGPSIGRKLVGPTHRKLIPIAAIISSIIIIFADAISRNLFSPIEIPVGITISIVGVPYFIYLMLKEKV